MTGLLDQAETERDRYRVRRVLCGQLVARAPHLPLYGRLGDAALAGDHAVGQPVREVAERGQFQRCQVALSLRLPGGLEVADEGAIHAR